MSTKNNTCYIITPEIKRKKMTSNKEMSTVKGKKIHYQENPQGKNLGKGKKYQTYT
jgi:hypothetical protein